MTSILPTPPTPPKNAVDILSSRQTDFNFDVTGLEEKMAVTGNTVHQYVFTVNFHSSETVKSSAKDLKGRVVYVAADNLDVALRVLQAYAKEVQKSGLAILEDKTCRHVFFSKPDKNGACTASLYKGSVEERKVAINQKLAADAKYYDTAYENWKNDCGLSTPAQTPLASNAIQANVTVTPGKGADGATREPICAYEGQVLPSQKEGYLDFYGQNATEDNASLGNFYWMEKPIKYQNYDFNTVEAAYQFGKIYHNTGVAEENKKKAAEYLGQATGQEAWEFAHPSKDPKDEEREDRVTASLEKFSSALKEQGKLAISTEKFDELRKLLVNYDHTKIDKDSKSKGDTVMEELVGKKFAQELYKTQLEATKGKYLRENTKPASATRLRDAYWGSDSDNNGANNLGRLLMCIRDGKTWKPEPVPNKA